MRHRLLLGFAASVVTLVSCSDDDSDSEDSEPVAVATTTPSNPGTTSSPTTAPSTSSTSPATSVPASTAPPTTATPSTAAPTTAAPTTTEAPAQSLGNPTVVFTQLGASRSGLLDIAAAPAGGLYQVFQDGTIVLTALDGADIAVALDITELTEGGGEQGLLGLAVHPANPLVYVNYTDNAGDTVVAEYGLADDGTFVADSARTLLTFDQPYPNHNGGGVVFGPDGYLYIGTGDGGAAGDPERHSLDPVTDSPASLLGKLLRIDPTPSGGQAYTVPADNPFIGEEGVAPEVWSYGLRNPWRFAFDETTGDLWIADVGQGDIEEIDVARARRGRRAGRALSFGWSAFEGTARFNDDQPADGHVPPAHEYQHTDGRCSVSGAAPYRGSRIPELGGGFVFGDYCTGEVWALGMDEPSHVVDLGSVPTLSAVKAVGDELYALSLTDGLFRIDPA